MNETVHWISSNVDDMNIFKSFWAVLVGASYSCRKAVTKAVKVGPSVGWLAGELVCSVPLCKLAQKCGSETLTSNILRQDCLLR